MPSYFKNSSDDEYTDKKLRGQSGLSSSIYIIIETKTKTTKNRRKKTMENRMVCSPMPIILKQIMELYIK